MTPVTPYLILTCYMLPYCGHSGEIRGDCRSVGLERLLRLRSSQQNKYLVDRRKHYWQKTFDRITRMLLVDYCHVAAPFISDEFVHTNTFCIKLKGRLATRPEYNIVRVEPDDSILSSAVCVIASSVSQGSS